MSGRKERIKKKDWKEDGHWKLKETWIGGALFCPPPHPEQQPRYLARSQALHTLDSVSMTCS